jgi:hypothetical protein
MRLRITAALVGGLLALSTLAGAFAFHPGVGNGNNSDHDMPQGPNTIACSKGLDNPSGKSASGGGWGVYNAIDRGGMVHCHPYVDEGDEGHDFLD